jgi:hypothetical protein
MPDLPGAVRGRSWNRRTFRLPFCKSPSATTMCPRRSGEDGVLIGRRGGRRTTDVSGGRKPTSVTGVNGRSAGAEAARRDSPGKDAVERREDRCLTQSSMTAWARAVGIVRWPLVATCLVIGLVRPLSALESIDLTAAQKGWALAASAVLWERNGDRHDLLAGRELTEANRHSSQRLLEESWGVRTREDLLGSLLWIHSGGHRQRFQQFGQRLAALSPAERRTLEPSRREQPDFSDELTVVEVYYASLGSKGLMGWDYSRYIALCRWGYASGYLSEDEAWGHIIRAARLLQTTFSSWNELGENYLIGREFWSPSAQRQNGYLYRRALQRLLADPESPWNQYPWDFDLGSRGAGDEQREAPERPE